jgi:hypothetical protein
VGVKQEDVDALVKIVLSTSKMGLIDVSDKLDRDMSRLEEFVEIELKERQIRNNVLAQLNKAMKG